MRSSGVRREPIDTDSGLETMTNTDVGISNPCRICVLTEAYYPIVGGAESHTKLLVKELRKQGILSIVLTRRTNRSIPREELVEDTRVVRIPPTGWRRWGKYAMLLPAVWKLFLLRKEYEIIYVCGFRVLGLIAVPVSKVLKKTCILKAECCGELSGEFMQATFDAGERRGFFRKRAMALLSHARKIILMRGDVYVSISEEIERELKGAGLNHGRIVSITNGIDTYRFSPPAEDEKKEVRRTMKIDEDHVVFTYTGKLNRGKGLEILLEAWHDFLREENRHRYILMMVGSGGGHYLSCEEELKEFVRENHLETSIMFTGYVEDVERYLKASDIFVFPSFSEALGISLLEALATGLPSIASNVGGIKDIIEDGINGMLIPPNDSKALLDKMRWMVRHAGEAERMAATGREMVVQRFGISHIAKEYSRLFRKARSCPPAAAN